MAIYKLIILASWLTLIAYWALLAGHSGPSLGKKVAWSREIGLRIAILVLVLVALHFLSVHQLRHYLVNRNPIACYLGAAVCSLGVLLAIWARICLGRNWGLPMSERSHPELITGGPYEYVRHPIYGGIIVALVGSAIGQSILWAIPLLIVGPYFIHSALREEALMAERFPLQYAEYMKRTKRLIPFIIQFNPGDVIRAKGRRLDWKRVRDLMSGHEELVLWSLVFFAYVYPAHVELIPRELWNSLLRGLENQLDHPRTDAPFRGSLIDPNMFAIVVTERGERDLFTENRERRQPLLEAEPQSKSEPGSGA